MGFIDIHQHINYGLDDGAPDMPIAARMVERAYRNGVTAIIATTHALSGRARFDLERYYRHLDNLTLYCQERGLPVQIYPGCEILYADSTVDDLLQGRFPTLAGSRFVLVEFDPGISYETLSNAVRMINNAGFVPVIAHVERYACMMKSLERIREIRGLYAARIQVNAHTVVHPRGFFFHRYLDTMLREGLVDYIASDAHNLTTRGVYMKEAYDVLKKQFGHEHAFRWFSGAQMEIIDHIT